jgi:hypothetical protein
VTGALRALPILVEALDARRRNVMQIAQRLGAVLVLGAVVAACGGNAATQGPAATQAGGGGGGGGGGATQQPAATDSGNGGNGGGDVTGGGLGGDTSHGTGHLEIGAPVSKTVDYAFSPPLSHFGGTDATNLYFVSTEGEQGALSLSWSSGLFIAVFTSTNGVVSGDECTVSNLKLDAGSASGTWECPKNTVVLASGASTQNVTFKGTFDAKG